MGIRACVRALTGALGRVKARCFKAQNRAQKKMLVNIYFPTADESVTRLVVLELPGITSPPSEIYVYINDFIRF